MSFNKEWNIKSASEFCYRVTDGTHDSPKKQKEGKFLITSRHLQKYNLDFSKAYKISNIDYENIKKRSNVEQWDILFSMIGTIGEIYIEKNKKIDYAIKNVGLFKFNKNILKANWVYYYLQSKKAKDYIHMSKGGSTQEYITLDLLRKFPLKYPKNKKEMKKIVSILNSIDSKIELNQQINHNLEVMAQAIFKHWFVDFEFPNENGEPYKSSGGEMVGSELGPIPKEWGVIPFKEIINISSGKRPKIMNKEKDKGFNIPLIGASSIMGYVSETLYVKPILIIGRVGTHGIVQRIKGKSWPSDNTLVIQPEYYEYTC